MPVSSRTMPSYLPMRAMRFLLAAILILSMVVACGGGDLESPSADDTASQPVPSSERDRVASDEDGEEYWDSSETTEGEAGDGREYELEYRIEPGLETSRPEPSPTASPPIPAPTAEPPLPVPPGSEERRLALDRVDVFFGTNRARHTDCREMSTVTWDSGGPCSNQSFYVAESGQEEPELEVGQVTITLPPKHTVGKIERPKTILTIQLRKEDPGKDVVLSRLRVFEEYDDWAGAVRGKGKSDAFVYVHGYATSFHDAALRAGQVSADLDFDDHGVPMLFSWPSVGDTESYALDYDVSLLATDAFNDFLDLVHERTGVERVHVIAHSMGNRVVANALRERDDPDRFIDQLILAAPDIHAETFRQRFLRILPDFAERVTLYVSDKDVALQVSERLRRQNPRAGQRRGGLLAERVERFDPVDATDLDTDFLSHSYYANHTSMLSDIFCVLRGATPASRPLLEAAEEGWRFGALRADEIDASACPDASPGASGDAD